MELSMDRIANQDFLLEFKHDISSIDLPKRFDFPFYYQPHDLAIIAAKELKSYLEQQTDFDHDFGIKTNTKGVSIGKMFGVLVVKDPSGKLGYLAAFSGKLANSNHHLGFVPPVFDVLDENGFYKKEERVISEITIKIDELEQNLEIQIVKKELDQLNDKINKSLKDARKKIKADKRKRKEERKAVEEKWSEKDISILVEKHTRESLNHQFYYRELNLYYQEQLAEIQSRYEGLMKEILQLREERKTRSADLQQRLFDEYFFYNANGDRKSLCDIFQHKIGIKPPAGAGECAAPKLIQYAYINQLQPICMAEFWWGAPPGAEVRKHGQYYPACRGKCEPILGHMLQGINLEPNPMLTAPIYEAEIPIVYEDDDILVINKPYEFLSVPGINIEDSVYTRIKALYPKANGPMIVHRLDMSTSGIMIITKTKEAHKILQHQFVTRTVKKRYIALLEGEVKNTNEFIDLPLRVDLDNRPHQLVCYEHGKPARTKWEQISVVKGRSKVYFYPITGRTHQLRVHASHPEGLGTPIVGDDLYGDRADRLYLHAERIEISHPRTNERMTFNVDADF